MARLASFWNRSPAPLVGVDISSSSIHVVELAQDKLGGWVLERCARTSLLGGWVEEGKMQCANEVAHALKRLLTQCGTRTKHAAVALPQSCVITKKIILPGCLSASELEVQVEAEASQYLPFPLDEVSLDFCVMGTNVDNTADVDVLLVATRKEKVQERRDVVAMAGLAPVVVDVESYASRLAAHRWLDTVRQGAEDTALIALLKLDMDSLHLQVLQGDALVYDNEQDIGAASLNTMLAAQSHPDASGGDGLQPLLRHLVSSAARAVQFFFSSTAYRRIERIAIFGGGACLPGVEVAMEQQVQIPVHVLDPFEGMHLQPGAKEQLLPPTAPAYVIACGLAMRRYFR